MRFGDSERERLIAAVREAAATEILPRFRALGEGEISAKSRADDLVTIADLRAEARITEAAMAILPGAAVIGEEAVARDAGLLDRIAEADLSVIIDPIDGTWNYANGLALFGVIVAVAARGETVFGLIYDPLGDDWLWAGRGEGAAFAGKNGAGRAVRSGQGGTRMAELAGLVGAWLFEGEERRRLHRVLPDFLRTSNYRCAAHEYRLLAEGRVDFLFTPSIKPWDHAAGCLAVEEAGGVARLLDGRDYRPTLRQGRLLVARSEAAWAAAAHALAEFDRPFDL